MSKRNETIDLEKALIRDTREKRIYGCEEITIGFVNSGLGNEIVDFMTMDSKGIIKCYELKVTLTDLKSSAKKSWYGNYNYLVVSSELYNKVKDWNEYVPEHVGIIAGTGLESQRKAKKCIIDKDTELMLKESMVRSMYWKVDKYKNANNLEKQKQLMSKISNAERERDNYYKRALHAENIINDYETYKSHNDGIDINLERMAKEERQRYRDKRGKELFA